MCYYFKNQIFLKKSATLLYCFFDIDLEKTNLAIFEDFSEIFYGLKLKAGLSYDKIVSYAMSKDTFKSPLAWAAFEIKVKRIAHSIVHFDQWNKLISKM